MYISLYKFADVCKAECAKETWNDLQDEGVPDDEEHQEAPVAPAPPSHASTPPSFTANNFVFSAFAHVLLQAGDRPRYAFMFLNGLLVRNDAGGAGGGFGQLSSTLPKRRAQTGNMSA